MTKKKQPKKKGRIGRWLEKKRKEAQERKQLESEIQVEINKVAREEYKKERIRLGKLKARKKAREDAQGGGSGIFKKLAKAGERLDTADLLGWKELQEKHKRREDN